MGHTPHLYRDEDQDAIGALPVIFGKEPRKILLQPHLEADGAGGVALRSFDATPAGEIESFLARFPAEDPELLALYEADLPHMAD